MSIKSNIIFTVARRTQRRIERTARHALAQQDALFHQLLHKAKETTFGKEFHFHSIKDQKQFAIRVAPGDYERFHPYINQVIGGKKDVLWPGMPLYFAKTSGTTSGVKYIPITRDSIPNHVGNARDALFNMTSLLQLKNLFDGKLMFLSGSPVLDTKGNIPTGRLSGIINHWVPSWLRGNQLPSYDINCIEDWETKVDAIAKQTLKSDLRLISGIPPWVQMYYEKILELSGKSTVKEVFPNLQLFIYGGVNYEPYRAQLEKLTGGYVPSLETYPASEGFIAYQDTTDVSNGLLLRTNNGIYFEFIPVSELNSSQPVRHSLAEVEIGINYAIILTTNAGLWAYDIGDTIEFISKDPYRIKVTGRTKHFISAFGEHVIAKEVEEALKQTVALYPALVNEFTVAPQVNPPDGDKPYHEWWIEFGEKPQDMDGFAKQLNLVMTRQNLYYEDLIAGNILQPLKVRALAPGAFKTYMQSIGKLGGQNKVPRLSNDRAIADVLQGLSVSSPDL